MDSVPFIEYALEPDKLTRYRKASEVVNPKTGKFYVDPEDDFLIGDSGGFLFNLSFKFINTHLLREVGIFYDKYRRFTDYAVDSHDYETFRLREEYRREHGFTAKCKLLPNGKVVDLHITGEHYNFINYGLIRKLDRSSIKPGREPKKIEGTPEFMDMQYFYYKAKRFSRLNGFNKTILKSRRKGFSYMEGVGSANDVNLIPGATIIHAAYDKKYLTHGRAISVMARNQLDFYENYTPFRRGATKLNGDAVGLLKRTDEELKLGYKLANGSEDGYLSSILSLTCKDNPDAPAGKDAHKIVFDEINNFPILNMTLGITEPTTRTGSYKTGWIACIGTGGSDEGNWIDMELNFYNPSVYGFMGYENVFSPNSRDSVCGLFIPYIWGLEGDIEGIPVLDDDGNTNFELALIISEKERAIKLEQSGYNSDYIMFCSQYCNTPEEAFSSNVSGLFTSVELKEHIKRLKSDSDLHFYTDGIIENAKDGVRFRSHEWLEANDMKDQIVPFIDTFPPRNNVDRRGCTRIYYPPFRLNGEVPKNLYFGVYDPVGVEKDGKSLTNKHSLASCQIWMYPNNYTGQSGRILVAEWVGRNDKLEKDDRIFANLLLLYNCGGLAEMNRGEVKTNFKTFGLLHKLLPNPLDVINENNNPAIGMVIGTGDVKLDGLNYLERFINEVIGVTETGQLKRLHTIPSLAFCQELDKFNNAGNFDRVSCGILAVYQFKAFTYVYGKKETQGLRSSHNKRLAEYLKNR